eukprot:GHVU01003694.1.p2 GENE.GHVU01003694.1~~GHVU01003694.1.p2  ORF type:complete len:229 (+),score=14.63 GHVU01003694.1:454-1140(+)
MAAEWASEMGLGHGYAAPSLSSAAPDAGVAATCATANGRDGGTRMEIGGTGTWTLSSTKPGHGVRQLRDGDTSTFWQSDGSGPHSVTIQFRDKKKISCISMYLNYRIDESYTPQTVVVKTGNSEADLEEITEVTFKEPVGWKRIPLNPAAVMQHRQIAPECFGTTPFPAHRLDHIRAFCVQIVVTKTHQSGKDIHIRQIRIFGPPPHVSRSTDSAVSSADPYFGQFGI